MEGYDLKEVLKNLDPAILDYQQWVFVGMALKEAGCTAADWDTWSQRDPRRYHAGECFKKWGSFNGGYGTPVTVGTIVQMAKDHGWVPTKADGDYELNWDASIGTKSDLVILQKEWVEGREISTPAEEWNPVQQLTTYLETLFEASENVGYVTHSWEKDGRYLPTKGCFDRTAGQLIEALGKCGGDIGKVLGDYSHEAGAWIRFNPLDGKGVKNENVTEYRYALVESDTMEIDRQNAIIRDLELPVACLVHSGRKSLHAIVHIDAGSYDEYRKRVDYLYEVCRQNGLTIDSQNRNPSRLSRMPGVLRNGNKQFLVDTNIGKTSFAEWKEWFESVNDDLPDPESMADAWDNLPELSPPLIDGVLRQGHKLLLAGPSKAGKSFALIELSCAIAEGRRWLNWDCTRGKVMYVNLELDRASCLRRFKDVYVALGYEPKNLSNIDIWNLRGKSIPMDKLAPKLIRRAIKKQYIAIVIDPIYKIITGDENSADQMAHFCNQFDKVCTELGCAVIYCHHHSKGTQGQKRSMDRASGSGVFARDPDALLDLIELEVTDDLYSQMENKAVCRACCDALNARLADWEDQVSQDTICSAVALQKSCEKLLSGAAYAELKDRIQAAKTAARQLTAWRIDGTLREFPKFPPVNLWFDFPVHHLDTVGSLDDIQADGAAFEWKEKGRRKAIDSKKSEKKDNWNKLENGFELLNINGTISISELMEYSGLTRNAVKSWADHQPNYERDNKGVITRVVTHDT